ncbi:response regulator transcription factor [Pedobacter sp. SYP-B3415]|uniref:response regulator transcription factor n=1 Tax=Pedobacter sp. SYP-B3415 TaxID=2496641 RepID=UPI0013EC0516|nr:response regulator transcription factor [Pedobacter sp. SYP-B3415]
MNKTIFLLEDDPDISDILAYVLDNSGYRVKATARVSDFCSDIEEQSPDLIILDIMLPDGNGIDVCSKIKHEKKWKNIPVIMMSAAYSAKDNICDQCGADGFISKPFDINQLLKRVEALAS